MLHCQPFLYNTNSLLALILQGKTLFFTFFNFFFKKVLTPQFINGILVLLLTKKSNKRLIKIVNYNCLTKSIVFDIFILRFKKKRKWSLKTEQNVNSISRDTNILKLQIIWKRFNIFFGEFDPGSGWTLAACLRHASRTKWSCEVGVLAQRRIRFAT